MTLLLVDDNPLFLEGLKALLEAQGWAIADTACCGEGALARLASLEAEDRMPEVVLMDIEMPGLGGIETTRRLKARWPDLRVVMMTVSQEEAHLFEAIVAGASGYLLKGGGPLFLTGLDELARGESPLSPGLAARLMAEFARRERARQPEPAPAREGPTPLSDRQREILALVSQGLPYRQVAERLSISEAAIKYHMGEIANRLHLENRRQIIAHAVRQGLLAP